MRSLVLALVVGWLAGEATACTTFCLKGDDRVVFGKNYDWTVAEGMLVINKRGVDRSSGSDDIANDFSWTSRYGSVTFNQYGRDQPSGGINEKGLVIELMWLAGTRYPAIDARPTVGALGWIQYQLDRSATVAELVASDAAIRIDSTTPLHWLVADATGDVATVEFLNGKLVPHHGASLQVAALTNDTYASSIGFLNTLERATPKDAGSLSRFARAARRVESFEAKSAARDVAYAFATLASTSNPTTRWSIVYEISARRVHYRTATSPRIKVVDLSRLDFACATPVLVLDLEANVSGDVSEKLVPYSTAQNQALLSAAFAKTSFLAQVPSAVIVDLASRPAKTACRSLDASVASAP